MHDLIFMYQPKPTSPLSLSHYKEKEKKREEICLPQATLPPHFGAFAELMSPRKNMEKKLLLHAMKVKRCSKVK